MRDQIVAIRNFVDGELVVSEGDSSHYAYVVLSGRAKVLRKLGDRNLQVGTIQEGQLFGEASFLGASTRSATVVADGPLELGLVPADLFLSSITGLPDEARERLTQLAKDLTYLNDVYIRLRECIDEIEDLRGSLIAPDEFERDVADLPELPRRIATEMRQRLHASVASCAELFRTLESIDQVATESPD